MSLINTEVKEFAVQAYHNGDFKEVTLESVKGKWSVFFFYPADFTFVCPTELGDLADNYAKFQEIGCELYSVSTDTHFVHKAWADASETIAKIQYPMLADPTGKLTRDFEVMIEEEGLALRGTFIVNPEEKLKHMKSMIMELDVMLKSYYVKYKLHNSLLSMEIKYAQLSGNQVLKH